MINIQSPSALRHYLKALIYADSGVGKTLLSATGEAHDGMRGTLVMNCEDGMLTLDGTSVQVTDKIKSIAQVGELISALYPTGSLHGKYQTLVVDGLSELQDIDLAEISKGNETITLQNYGTSTKHMRAMMRYVRDLPMNVIVTALAKTIYPENATMPTEVYPQLTKEASKRVCSLMDHVWYLRVDDGKRRLWTQPAGPVKAKTRGPEFAKAIGSVIDDPNLATIYEHF